MATENRLLPLVSDQGVRRVAEEGVARPGGGGVMGFLARHPGLTALGAGLLAGGGALAAGRGGEGARLAGAGSAASLLQGFGVGQQQARANAQLRQRQQLLERQAQQQEFQRLGTMMDRALAVGDTKVAEASWKALISASGADPTEFASVLSFKTATKLPNMGATATWNLTDEQLAENIAFIDDPTNRTVLMTPEGLAWKDDTTKFARAQQEQRQRMELRSPEQVRAEARARALGTAEGEAEAVAMADAGDVPPSIVAEAARDEFTQRFAIAGRPDAAQLGEALYQRLSLMEPVDQGRVIRTLNELLPQIPAGMRFLQAFIANSQQGEINPELLILASAEVSNATQEDLASMRKIREEAEANPQIDEEFVEQLRQYEMALVAALGARLSDITNVKDVSDLQQAMPFIEAQVQETLRRRAVGGVVNGR